MLVVFDWDGTLMNSTAKIVRSMQIAAERCRLLVLPDESVKNIIGLGLPEAILHLYPQASAHDREQLRQQYSHAYVEQDQTVCAFFEGAESCLDALEVQGHQIAVATGKSRRGLNRVLQQVGWQDRFHATRCADETASKPHPLMLFELMEELSASPDDVYMVGDTEYDLEMAANAGIKSIGVSYGAHPVLRLQKHKPIAVLDNLNILSQLIE